MTTKLSKKTTLVLAAFGLGMMLSLSSHALTDQQKKAIDARTQPVGTECVEGDSTCGGAMVAAAAGKPKSGEEIYNTTCHMCHAAGVAGAPKFGNKADWKPRIAQGINTLHDHAIHGYKGMPPKGTCAACTDDEIKAAVDYMVAHAK